MRYLSLTLAMMLPAAASVAGTVRSASWFADHPAERRMVLAYCNDDPGEARSMPNCENALKGDFLVAEADARRRTGMNVSPTNPAYWTRPENAEQLRFWSLQCARASGASADVRRSMNCDAIAQAGR